MKLSVEKLLVSHEPVKSPPSQEVSRRRSYKSPRLTDLGDVKELTRALLSVKGALDGMTIGAMDLKTGGL